MFLISPTDRLNMLSDQFVFITGEEKINEMKVHKGNMERITKMVAEQVQVLKTQCDRERENAKILKIEAEKVNH